MRTNRHGWAIAAVLLSVTIGPFGAQAAWCFSARHACHPAPALVACCCDVGAAEQPSLATGSAVVHSPASVEASPGQFISAVPDGTFSRRTATASSPPVDRLALFSQLLI
jgi:hypothetical protein